MRKTRLFVAIVVVLALQLAALSQGTSTKTYSIAGVAVDHRSGQPLANAKISITATTKPDDSRSVSTGSDGKFRFDNLPKGKYSLTGSRRGYLEQGYDQHEQYASAIAVGDDQDSTHLVFQLHPDASIHGRIVDENGEAAAQIQVWLFSTRNEVGLRSTRVTAQASTNDFGEYSFAHLEEGTYYVLAMGKPWYATINHQQSVQRARNREDGRTGTAEHEQIVAREEEALAKTYPLTFFDNVQDWTQASAIDLAPGDRFEADFRIAAVPAAQIRVGGEPVAGDSEHARFRMPRLSLQARVFGDQMVPLNIEYGSAGDGSTVARGIPPGRYVAEVRDPNDPHVTAQEIDVAGDMDLPKLTGGTGSTVSGKFVWEGTPVQRGFGVALTNSRTSRNYFCMPRPDGQFAVAESVEPGKYEVVVGSRQNDLYVKSVEIAGVKSSNMVEIGNGTDVNMTVTLAHGTATIDGVALLDGKPKAGVMVVLVPANGWVGTARFRRDQSDSDGTFTLRNVVPGSYKVVALRDGWKLPWSDPKVMKSYLGEGTAVQVNADQKAQVSVKVK